MTLDIDWILTVLGLGVGVAMLGAALWQDSRPRQDLARARWISWRFVMLLAGAILLLAAVHAANKLGVHTGGNRGGLGAP